MTGRKTTTLVLGLVVAVVASTCSGGDEALTKAQYVEQGNSICEASNSEIEAIEEELGEAIEEQLGEAEQVPTIGEFAQMTGDLVDRTIPVLQAAIADLRALPAPEADEDTLTALYNDFEKVLADLSEQSEVLTSGDEAAITRFYEVDFFGDVSQRFAQYGLTVCAEQ